MMHDDEIAATYSDLLPSRAETDGEHQRDTALWLLISDLDKVLDSESVPPGLEERIAAALHRQASQTRPARLVIRPLSHRRSVSGAVRPGILSRGAADMEPKRISIIASSVVAFVVVALIAILVHGAQSSGSASRPGASIQTPSQQQFQQQWSQRGGIQFLLTVAAGTDSQAVSADVLTIKRRLATLVNPSDTQVYVHHLANGLPSNIIVVEVAGHAADEASIASLLDATGQLDIIDTGSTFLDIGTDVTGQTCDSSCAPGQYKIIFTGDQLDPNSISAKLDPSINLPVIQAAFQRAAQSAFATYTQANIGNYLTLTLDNKVIESATIQSQISGPFEISGITTLAQAQNLATLLKYGPLSAPVIASTHQIIQPGTPPPTTS